MPSEPTITDRSASQLRPSRGLVLVRPVETPERLAHSRIILTDKTREVMTTHQMEVVSVGAPSICEDPDCERPHAWNHHVGGVSQGDWVLVRHRSLTETHEDNLFAVAQDDVLAILQAK